MRPKVSVIIPVYNGEEYLGHCLDSILCQTLQDIEVICVDDGSTDNTPIMLRNYKRHDSRVKPVFQEHGGAGVARNIGMKYAQGEYLSFLDADDFFELSMLGRCVDALEHSDTDFVVFHADSYDDKANRFEFLPYSVLDKEIPPYRPLSFRNLTTNVFRVFIGWAWDKVYRADFIRKHDLTFQEQRTTNDMRFVFSALVLAEKFEVLPQILAHHRKNNMNSLSNTREPSWRCFYDALLGLRTNLRQYGLYEELERDFINYALYFSLWNYKTLQGSCRHKLRRALKTEWGRELGIAGKQEDYFYDKKEFKELKRI